MKTFIVLLFCWFTLSASGQKYAPPTNTGDPAKLGVNIQRAMTLLATSTPEKRNTVRILFYGQSITEQDWWKSVAADLKARFPHANLIIENRALGGFASQMLVNTAETDVYPFQPDLLIFYVYGSHIEYENIIRRTRERTCADIVIQTDHATKDEDLTEETDPAKLFPSGKIWNSFMNYKFLPEISQKYGTGLIDQRNLWKAYLKQRDLPAQKLLRDGVHLNELGNYVMAELVKPYLVKRDDAKIDPMNCERVTTIPWPSLGQVTAAFAKFGEMKGGSVVVNFEGNRVDAVFSDSASGKASVLIDDVKPSAHPELYGVTRASAKPGGKWPPVTNISWDKQPVIEEWTMWVKKDPANEKQFTFAVKGSETGEDGEGASDALFVSKSGRIRIAPESWNVPYALGLAGVKPVSAEFLVSWKVLPRFVDEVSAPPAEKGIERVQTIAQWLSNGKHRIVIEGDAGITALRIYRPPHSQK